MARNTTTSVTLSDDLTPTVTDGVETVTVRITGMDAFKIDLGPANLAKLHKSVEKFAAAGRVTASGAPSVDQSAAREWARKNGYNVKDRGRLSKEIHDAFAAAQV